MFYFGYTQTNQEMFTKWFKERLLPNIPARSVIIMDNASYHNVLSPASAPTPSCKKEKIRSWLERNNFPVKEDCLKVELVEILAKVGPEATYIVDEIAREQGHDVLRTPPYHPELQPIETCWGIVKNEIARNCDFTMDNLIFQVGNAFKKVAAKTCVGLIEKIRDVEDTFWRDDAALDEQN